MLLASDAKYIHLLLIFHTFQRYTIQFVQSFASLVQSFACLLFAYRTVAVVHFTEQIWIAKTVYWFRCVLVCEIGFTSWNARIALLRASMVVTYCIKLFQTGADGHNVILCYSLSSSRDNKLLLYTIYLCYWQFCFQ